MSAKSYLYEMIEDYKEKTSNEDKNKIFDEFCTTLWNGDNKRRTYTKSIKFKVRDDLLETEIGQIFNVWSVVEYKGYKAISKDNNWDDLIKQKINNLYTKYFDKDVILNKEYMDLLKTPKKLYYRWIKGFDINVDTLTETIDSAINSAEDVKKKFQKQKIELPWDEYVILIEKFLRIIFDNCMTVDDYENKYGAPNYVLFNEFATDDNFYVKYICKSLESYMLNFQKEYYGLKRGRNKQYKHCEKCGALIEKSNNRVKYCRECAVKINREKTKINMKNIRMKDV